MRDYIEISSFKLISHDVSQVETKSSKIELPIKIQIPKLAQKTSTRLAFKPNLMNQKYWVPKKMDVRTQPVRYYYTATNIDSITYKIPAGYTVESQNDSAYIETDFGYFTSATHILDETTLLYARRYEIREKIIPAEKYNEYREFLKYIAKADKKKIYLKKKN